MVHGSRVLCVCVYTYIHTHIYTYIHTYIRPYIRSYMHTCIHTCIHTYIHKYMHTYMHTYIHTYTHTYAHTYIHTYIHTYAHTHTHTYTHIYNDIHSLRITPCSRSTWARGCGCCMTMASTTPALCSPTSSRRRNISSGTHMSEEICESDVNKSKETYKRVALTV